jgi:hypothetical protein
MQNIVFVRFVEVQSNFYTITPCPYITFSSVYKKNWTFQIQISYNVL